MKRMLQKRIISGALALLLAIFAINTGVGSALAEKPIAAQDCTASALNCPLQDVPVLVTALTDLTTPALQAPKPKKAVVNVTYSVETRGTITADLAIFKKYANETLNDGRGWSQMGVAFNEVASGGSFTLVFAEAASVAEFSSGCDAMYSCNVGRYVIINQDRWQGATPSWNAGGGSLRDYRHMVVNHETGHWLGHGHANCAAPGQPAAVMQQQSIDLQGCTFNPWPLPSELNSSRLGL